jgi:hypothetical protein
MTLGGLVRRVANDAQKFYLSLIVCKSVPIETLVAQIQKKIRKESVVSESEFWFAVSRGDRRANMCQSPKRPATRTWWRRRRI